MDYTDYISKMDAGDILDVACGTGGSANRLLDLIKDYNSLTGIDINPDYKQKFLKNIEHNNIFFTASGIGGFIDSGKKFDTVQFSYSLHHIEGIEDVLNRVCNLLKPGGVVLLFEMYSDDLNETQNMQKRIHHFAAFLDSAAGAYHRQTYSKIEIRRLAAKCRFRTVKEFETDNGAGIITDSGEIEKLFKGIRKKAEKSFGGSIPEETLKAIEELHNSVSETGFSCPPALIFVGEF